MTNYKLEYLWLDGYTPIANLRSKTKILASDDFSGELDQVPEWNFDGSSTQQASGSNSEVLLKPVRVYPDVASSNAKPPRLFRTLRVVWRDDDLFLTRVAATR